MKIKKILLLILSILSLSCSDPDPALEDLVNQLTIETESRYLIANNMSTIPIQILSNLNPVEATQLNIKYFANGKRRYLTINQVESIIKTELIKNR